MRFWVWSEAGPQITYLTPVLWTRIEDKKGFELKWTGLRIRKSQIIFKKGRPKRNKNGAYSDEYRYHIPVLNNFNFQCLDTDPDPDSAKACIRIRIIALHCSRWRAPHRRSPSRTEGKKGQSREIFGMGHKHADRLHGKSPQIILKPVLWTRMDSDSNEPVSVSGKAKLSLRKGNDRETKKNGAQMNTVYRYQYCIF